jgi:Domain of unknown function (DUF4268)
MTKPLLGELKAVELREVWSNEANDFTPWLSSEENLRLLGATISLELELVETEKTVGPYRADVLCRDTVTDSLVLIENQLEKTNHTHLGQLLTYAAGLNTVTIVWIASRFTEEHRAAIDWLNTLTPDDINFFALEVEVWQIGDSSPAPKFNVVSKPNDWTKGQAGIRTKFESSEVSRTGKLQLEYWTALKELLDQSSKILSARKPRPQYWYPLAIGRTKFHLSARVKTKDSMLECSLVIKGPLVKHHFAALKEHEVEIAQKLGDDVIWNEMQGKKSSEILINVVCNPTDKSDWPTQHKWFMKTLESMYQVFSPLVKELPTNLEEYEENDE